MPTSGPVIHFVGSSLSPICLLREFASEVLREHYLARRTQLTASDYDAFFNSKALGMKSLKCC
jgi:hypothetical protein